MRFKDLNIIAPNEVLSRYNIRIPRVEKDGIKCANMARKSFRDSDNFGSDSIDKQMLSKTRQDPSLSKNGVLPVAVAIAIAALTNTYLSEASAVAPTPSVSSVLPNALWAYAHYFSIIAITLCLASERALVDADMPIEDEETVVKIDVAYGLLAALLIISGFVRAAAFGKGGDYYIHEILFWVKMCVSGIWGGMSIFPSLTFYKRKADRNKGETVSPLGDALAARLRQIIDAEIVAMLSIPLLATLMARGVLYSNDFPWQVGMVLALSCTVGSFAFYGRQALQWEKKNL